MIGLVVVTLLAAGERDWQCDAATEVWAPLQLPAPCVVLKDAKPETRSALLQKAWNLDATQAACALRAIDAAPGEALDREPGPSTWQQCVDQFPTVLAFWPPTFGMYRPHRQLAAPVAQLVAMGPEGQQIIEKLTALQSPPIEVMLAAFRATPSSLVSLLSKERVDDEVRAELAATALEERGPQLTKKEWATLSGPLLKSPLRFQDVLLAAELFQKLPAFEQKRLSNATSELETDFYGSPRVLLAIGLIALNEKKLARAIQLAPAEPAPLGPLWREVLKFLLTNKRATAPWEAAIAAAEGNLRGPALLVASLPYFGDAAELPAREVLRALKWSARDCADFTEGFERRILESRARALKMLAERRLLPAVTPSPTAALPESLPSPWKERTEKWAGPSNTPTTRRLPNRFWQVRAEKQGTRLVALVTSQSLDPVGEIGPGAYWLLLSTDNGDSWQPTYLGLVDHHPFHANASSTVPLIDEHDIVRLDLEDAPLDERSITLPPIGLTTTTRRAHIILEASLAQLDEDFDHDGLSNLVEARLLLDPRNPDTDGDGFIDGDDFTPRIDDHLAPTVKAEMLNAFFEDFGSGRKAPQAIVMSPDHDGGLDLGRARASTLDDVHFLLGTPEELAGVKPMGTFITLTDAELELARARYGTFYPMDLTITVFGNDHAYIRWSEQWRGGSVRVDRDKNGKLVVKSLSSWIT